MKEFWTKLLKDFRSRQCQLRGDNVIFCNLSWFKELWDKVDFKIGIINLADEFLKEYPEKRCSTSRVYLFFFSAYSSQQIDASRDIRIRFLKWCIKNNKRINCNEYWKHWEWN